MTTRMARALLSVSNKQGLAPFARTLAEAGVTLLSTGGTARLLRDHGLAVTEVSAYTGFPEIMDGRVKTLHPKVHGAILGRRGVDDEVMQQHGISPIDLVVVNLYPFTSATIDPDCTLETAIEHIDIGGPALLRAAAKNHQNVVVVVDPDDYPWVLEEMRSQGAISDQARLRLAAKAFDHTARYDGAIAEFLNTRLADEGLPEVLDLRFTRLQSMRYGENPHQQAAFYRDAQLHEASLATARQLQGKTLSYNNVADADAALACVKAFMDPACVIVKHANPCGVALGADLRSAYARAFQTDPTSAFGGIIAFNRPLDATTSAQVLERQFVEVILAPQADPAAQAVLAQKPNVRVLVCEGPWDPASGLTSEDPQPAAHRPAWDFKRVTGGLLVQTRDDGRIGHSDLKQVTRRAPSQTELEDLLFAWQVVKFVKSNAIVYARDRQTIGIGAGQMSRVDSARLAGLKAADAGLQVQGAVMASDAFFPFRDGIDAAHQVGIRAVIQPGGSMRDEAVIAAADEYDMAMVFTGMRHFRH